MNNYNNSQIKIYCHMIQLLNISDSIENNISKCILSVIGYTPFLKLHNRISELSVQYRIGKH